MAQSERETDSGDRCTDREKCMECRGKKQERLAWQRDWREDEPSVADTDIDWQLQICKDRQNLRVSEEFDNWSMTAKLVLWETQPMLKEINMENQRYFLFKCLDCEQKIIFIFPKGFLAKHPKSILKRVVYPKLNIL